jgi:hypothetical protein
MSLKFLGPLAGVSVAAMLAFGLAPAANAAGQDATINPNEFVFFYNSDFAGSYDDFINPQSSLAGFTFIKPGLNGYGQAVKNNSASVGNYKPQPVRIYYNSGYAGVYDQVAAATPSSPAGRNLVSTYNQNASFQWGSW